MRIRIEIDGRTVLDTNVEGPPEAHLPKPYAGDEQPPEALLKEARARGAASAGRAAYVQAAGAAVTRQSLIASHLAASLAAPRTRLDAEAGLSAAVGGGADEPPRSRGRGKSRSRRAKKTRA